LIDNLALATTGGGSATAVPTRLSGGEDGLVPDPAATGVTDFHQDLLALFAPGGIADRLDLFNILCVPGLAETATIAKLQGFARARRAFLVIDARENDTISALSAPPAALAGDDALNSALYFPWVLAPDPLEPGAARAYPPCGAIAGLYARTDATRGVWKAPAGIQADLNGILGLKVRVSDAQNAQINRRGVNCLRTFPVYGPVVWGARTLHGDDDRGSEWKYIPVRRMTLFLEESLTRGTQWAVFEPNDEPLRAQIRLAIGAFLNGLFRQGAFQGKTPNDAYFVRCDRETTTQTDIDNGIVNILVGFAPLKPAEFVIIKIQQIAGNMPT
jgi:phage tail sheath protein FI